MILFLWGAIIAVTIGLDQWSKLIAVENLKPIGSYPLWKDVFHLTYVENTGAAFGTFKDSRWVFMILSSVAIIGVIIYLIWQHKKIPVLFGISLSLVAGGGIGNMIDRIRLGYVVDFFDFTLINFAVFNVADSFVTIGAALMILYMVVTEIKLYRERKKQSVSTGDGDVEKKKLDPDIK